MIILTPLSIVVFIIIVGVGHLYYGRKRRHVAKEIKKSTGKNSQCGLGTFQYLIGR